MNENDILEEENIYFGGAETAPVSVDSDPESAPVVSSPVPVSVNPDTEPPAPAAPAVPSAGAEPGAEPEPGAEYSPRSAPGAAAAEGRGEEGTIEEGTGQKRTGEEGRGEEGTEEETTGETDVKPKEPKKTLFIKDEYDELKILINFCNIDDNNINLINFINKEENNKDCKKTFLSYLKLFDSEKYKDQTGGVGGKFIMFFNKLRRRLNRGNKKDNLTQAINNMKERIGEGNIKDEIENNKVYEFINLLNLNETNNTKLTINHKKYNDFMKDFEEEYKIINYINYIKDIEITLDKGGGIFGFLDSNNGKKIYNTIKDFIEKYNKMRLNIFNNYLNIELENKENKEDVGANVENKMYKIYFNDISEKDENINKNFSKKVLQIRDIDDYIDKINDYSNEQIKEIDQKIKEYIFLIFNQNLIKEVNTEGGEGGEREVPPAEIGGKKYRKTKNKKYYKKRPTKKRRKRKFSRKK